MGKCNRINRSTWIFGWLACFYVDASTFLVFSNQNKGRLCKCSSTDATSINWQRENCELYSYKYRNSIAIFYRNLLLWNGTLVHSHCSHFRVNYVILSL